MRMLTDSLFRYDNFSGLQVQAAYCEIMEIDQIRYGNALQEAAYRADKEIVQMLLEKGADVNAQGGKYGNALQAASQGGHKNVVKTLLDKGTDRPDDFEQDDPWARELEQVGFSKEEIMELSEEHRKDSPWIFSEPSAISSEPVGILKGNHHIPGCPDQDLNNNLSGNVEVRTIFSETDQDLLRKQGNPTTRSPTIPSIENQPEIAVHTLCGLGGIRPIKLESTVSVADVAFRDENRAANLAYPRNNDLSAIFLIREVLQRFCSAAGSLQDRGLCCDSFTFLRRHLVDRDAIELCRLDLMLPSRLLDVLNDIEYPENINS